MSQKELILVGGGGHCKACIDVIEAEATFRICGIVDVESKRNQKILGYQVIGSDADLPDLVAKHKNVLVAIGGTRDLTVRTERFEYLKNLGARFPVIVSPLAYVSRSAVLEEGTIVMHRALVDAEAVVGANCIINTCAVVEHDCRVGDHCHISAGSIVNGACRIGKRVFIGSNSVVAHDVSVVDDVVVGAGAFVGKSIVQPGIYMAPGKLVGICKV